jgi:hypothetical protein
MKKDDILEGMPPFDIEVLLPVKVWAQGLELARAELGPSVAQFRDRPAEFPAHGRTGDRRQCQ